MSSRFTSPISKLTRTFSTTPAVARPSHLLTNAPKVATTGRKPNPIADEPSSERNHSTTTTTATSPHRPTSTSPLPTRKPIPFMQTFHHSAPKPTPASAATIDRAILPDLSLESEEYDPYLHIRVPLLPDNTVPPPAAFHQPEAVDAPLPHPEILVVAADPAQVLPSALTEVEGMGVDGVELGFAHLLGREAEKEESYEMGAGMIRDLWRGMVDDVFGGGRSSGSGKAAV